MTALNLPPNLTLLLLFFFFLSHLVMSNSLQPHGLQPTRLLCPCNSPCKNTGVGSYRIPSPGDLPNTAVILGLSHQGSPHLIVKEKKFSNVVQSFVFQHNIHIFCDAGLVDRIVIFLLSVLEYELLRNISAKVYHSIQKLHSFSPRYVVQPSDSNGLHWNAKTIIWIN